MLSSFGVVGGGVGNTIQTSAFDATIGGGGENTILSNAQYATIPGGEHNWATTYAFAAGRRAKANHPGAFVWADSQNADFASTADNEFAVRASGGVRLATSYMSVTGGGNEQAYLGGDGNGGDVEIGSRNAAIMNVGFWNAAAFSHMNLYALTFNPGSDRNIKQDFKPVDAKAILDKVIALPVREWAYKADAQTRHLGPVAQDFQAAFALGSSDKSIATVDADGVALAAIQA